MEGEYNMAKQKQKPFNERSMETTQAIRDMLSMFSYLKLSKVNEEKRKELQKFIDDAYKIIEQEIEKYGGKLDSEDQTGK